MCGSTTGTEDANYEQTPTEYPTYLPVTYPMHQPQFDRFYHHPLVILCTFKVSPAECVDTRLHQLEAVARISEWTPVPTEETCRAQFTYTPLEALGFGVYGSGLRSVCA